MAKDLLSMSLQKLDNELTCPVCTEHYKEPKHAFTTIASAKFAVQDTLRAAEMSNAKSIALPALGCGTFSVSKDLMACSINRQL